jgi:spore germination protein
MESGALSVYIHVVQSGDTLWHISRRYGVSMNLIIQTNGLESPAKLLVGQAILIPVLYRRYTVRPGDSLWQIANQNKTTIQAILDLNTGLNPSLLYVGQSIRIPEKQKPAIEVNAFTTSYGQTGAGDVQEVSTLLTYVSPFGYRIQSDGRLTPVDDTTMIQVAKSALVAPMMTITNFSATETGTELVHTLFASTELQETLLVNMIDIMHQKGYLGLNVDFENVAPNDKDLYNQFLQRTVTRLHSAGFFVSSSLAPKISGEEKGLLYEAHDYPAHGRILDFVVLMTYEWGYRLGPPQAISPVNQIRRVLDYAVTVIPRNKILMGFQLYARDWRLPHVQGQVAETFDMQEAIRRATQYNVTIQYDQTAASPFYWYKDSGDEAHVVWFEDARSAKSKFDLVKIYKLRGISYWVLGFPFPQNWSLLQNTFQIRKRLPPS